MNYWNLEKELDNGLKSSNRFKLRMTIPQLTFQNFPSKICNTKRNSKTFDIKIKRRRHFVAANKPLLFAEYAAYEQEYGGRKWKKFTAPIYLNEKW